MFCPKLGGKVLRPADSRIHDVLPRHPPPLRKPAIPRARWSALRFASRASSAPLPEMRREAVLTSGEWVHDMWL